MTYSKDWEELNGDTDRLKVPGGWILRSYVGGMEAKTLHQVFISDPEHTWKFNE